MANFTTHLTVATIASTALAITGFLGGLFGFGTAVFCLISGVIGGLLPDIDLESSTPAKHFFSLISLFVATLSAILYTTYQTGQHLVMHAVIIWAVAYVIMRHGVIGLFSHFTKHRGMVHSVPYMAMFGLIAVYGAFYAFNMTAKVSWFFGGFLFIGGLVHLLLDEIYSVNVLGLKLKKSFGTAFKFFERQKLIQYFILYALVITLLYFAPDHHSAFNSIKSFMIKIINKDI